MLVYISSVPCLLICLPVSLFLFIGLPAVCLFDSSVGHSFVSLFLLFICPFVVCLFGCLVTQLVFFNFLITAAHELQRLRVRSNLIIK